MHLGPLFFAARLLWVAGPALPQPGAAAVAERMCWSPPETREVVAAERLIQPFRALRAAAFFVNGEPLKSRLCRRDGKIVYDMTLLSRDGKVVRIVMDAADGTILVPQRDR